MNAESRSRRTARRSMKYAAILSLFSLAIPLAVELPTLARAAELPAATGPQATSGRTREPIVASGRIEEVTTTLSTESGWSADVFDARVASPVTPLVAESGSERWRGAARRDGFVRSAPTRTAPVLRDLRPGEAVEVLAWTRGDEIERENPVWAEINPGEFVYGMLLSPDALDAPPVPPAAPTSGRWIDVNLTLQTATAYDGNQVVRLARISSGQPGWETPEGTFPVLRRVEKETMDGRSLLGQGPDGRGASYRIENVRFTQYFSRDGAAIHENSWRSPAAFGVPGSHGCIGMTSEDAAWFWGWATTGTPLVIHS